MLVCFPFHAQVVANVHITCLGASENTDQTGKNTLKDEKRTNQKNTVFQSSAVFMVLSILYMEYFFSLNKFRSVLFCFLVILNAEKLLKVWESSKKTKNCADLFSFFLSITVCSAWEVRNQTGKYRFLSIFPLCLCCAVDNTLSIGGFFFFSWCQLACDPANCHFHKALFIFLGLGKLYQRHLEQWGT